MPEPCGACGTRPDRAGFAWCGRCGALLAAEPDAVVAPTALADPPVVAGRERRRSAGILVLAVLAVLTVGGRALLEDGPSGLRDATVALPDPPRAVRTVPPPARPLPRPAPGIRCTDLPRWCRVLPSDGRDTVVAATGGRDVGVVLVADGVLGLDLVDGRTVWERPLAAGTLPGLVVAPTSGRVDDTTTDGTGTSDLVLLRDGLLTLHAIRVADGAIVWTRPQVRQVAVADDLLVTTQVDGSVVGRDLATGGVRWTGGPRGSGDVAPAVDTDVVAVTDGTTVHLLDTGDGSTRWSRPAPRTTGLVLAGGATGVVVSGEANGLLTALARADGAARWAVRGPLDVVLLDDPFLADVLALGVGVVERFDPATGTRRAQVPVSPTLPVRGRFDAAGDLVLTGDRTLSVVRDDELLLASAGAGARLVGSAALVDGHVLVTTREVVAFVSVPDPLDTPELPYPVFVDVAPDGLLGTLPRPPLVASPR